MQRKHNLYRNHIKRLLDIIFSLIAIIVLCWLFAILAILVRACLGKPVLFTQDRPGKDEKIFKLYKFRTMKDPVEVKTGRKLSDEERLLIIKEEGLDAVTSDEQRLTTLGRFLRAASIDELPELINVIKGDMSIVGPRPLAVIYLPFYNEQEKHRHDVLPGLTGLAQVNGRNVISWEKRFEYDLEYVDNVSFMGDLKIILKTIMVVFKHSDVAQGEQQPEPFHVVRQREWDEKSQINN